MRTVLLVGVMLLAFGACRKPKPSLEYMEASGRYTTLLAEQGDDAFEDPEMARLEALLRSVPADSLDAQAAAQLLATIAAERKRLADVAAAKQKALDAPPAAVTFDAPQAPPERAPEGAPDAGAPTELKTGMTIEDVRKVSDNCFASSGPLKVRNPDRSEGTAEMYERVDSTRCRERYGKYEGRFLLFRDGKLFGDYEKSALAPMNVVPAQPPAPAPAPPPPAPVVEPGGDKPPTPLPPPPNPGEQTGPAPVGP